MGHFFSHFPGSSFFSIFPTFAAFIAVVFLLAEWFPTQAAGDSWLQEQPGVAEAGDPFQADTEPVLPEVLVRPDELPPAPAEGVTVYVASESNSTVTV